jgi:hypothetical protein
MMREMHDGVGGHLVAAISLIERPRGAPSSVVRNSCGSMLGAARSAPAFIRALPQIDTPSQQIPELLATVCRARTRGRMAIAKSHSPARVAAQQRTFNTRGDERRETEQERRKPALNVWTVASTRTLSVEGRVA